MANRKKISELPLVNLPSLTGVTPVVLDGVTYQSTLESIKTVFSTNLNSIDFNLTPTGITHVDGQVFFDEVNHTLAVHLPNDVTLQIGQEEHVYVYNDNAYTIHNGKAVSIHGAFNDYPSVMLSDASEQSSSYSIGLSTQEIPPNTYGYITFFGLVHDVDTSLWSVNDLLYISDIVPGDLQNFQVSSHTSFNVRMGKVIKSDPTTGIIFVRQLPFSKLSDLGDVTIDTPIVDETLRFNGLKWVNSTANPGSDSKVTFYFDETDQLIGGSQSISIETLALVPNTTPETEEIITVNSLNPISIFDSYITTDPLDRERLEGGEWVWKLWRYIDHLSGTTEMLMSIMSHETVHNGTLTITGTGTTRLATSIGVTPFLSNLANVDIFLASCLSTPNAHFFITNFISSTEVEIQCLSGYTNETNVVFEIGTRLFGMTTGEIDDEIISVQTIKSVQPPYVITRTCKLGAHVFAKTNSVSDVTIHFFYNGLNHYSHIGTPLNILHNSLSGMYGSDPYWHLGETEHADLTAGFQGTGKIVRETSPVLVTPNIGEALGTSLRLGDGLLLPNSVFNSSGSNDGVLQDNLQNKSSGEYASGDFIVTSDTGDNNNQYIDLGLNSSGYNDPAFSATGPLDGYLYVDGGNLVFGTRTPGKVVKFHTGGTTLGDIRFIIDDNGIQLSKGNNIRLQGLTSGEATIVVDDIAGNPTLILPKTSGTLALLSDITGTTGTSGTSGTSGSSGSSGTSGTSGSSGSSGTSGTSGSSGSTGTSGTSGVGTSGTSGTSGLGTIIGTGVAKITVGTTEPSTPTTGDLWVDTN